MTRSRKHGATVTAYVAGGIIGAIPGCWLFELCESDNQGTLGLVLMFACIFIGIVAGELVANLLNRRKA